MATQVRDIERPMKLFFVSYTPPNVNEELAPIIFLHGLIGTNCSWNKVKVPISESTRRKVFLLDLRNHGKSEWCHETSLKYCAIDVENFMSSENIPKAVFVGHSYGARIAITLAFKRPEIVEKLVIEETALEIPDHDVRQFKKFVDLLNQLKSNSLSLPENVTLVEAQKTVVRYLAMHSPQISAQIAEHSIPVVLPFHLGKSGKMIWDMNFDALLAIREDISKLAIDLSENPVYHGDMLLIGGNKSQSLRETDVEQFKKHFPNCQSHFFENGYHTLHVEFPAKYAELVSKFIGK